MQYQFCVGYVKDSVFGYDDFYVVLVCEWQCVVWQDFGVVVFVGVCQCGNYFVCVVVKVYCFVNVGLLFVVVIVCLVGEVVQCIYL